MKGIVTLVQHRLRAFLKGSESESDLSVIGTLELMQELLLNTEYFGVGTLRAHNSLIPTSTVTLKVYNNCTYGDDVQKIF